MGECPYADGTPLGASVNTFCKVALRFVPLLRGSCLRYRRGATSPFRGMHLNEDVCVFELVDESGVPVKPVERAAKLYITPLFNVAQPLIRYELTDELTVIDAPCAC